MSRQVNLYEAKTTLSSLVEEAAAGAEIVICKNGKPKARLMPVAEASARTGKRELGFLRGTIGYQPGWDEPLPSDHWSVLGGDPKDPLEWADGKDPDEAASR